MRPEGNPGLMKKGTSGNPKGRPKGIKEIKPRRAFRDLLAAFYHREVNGPQRIIEMIKDNGSAKNDKNFVEYVNRFLIPLALKSVPEEVNLGASGNGRVSIRLEMILEGNNNQVQGKPDA
jgi:hypothetical protein